jgi:hypothetical protein
MAIDRATPFWSDGVAAAKRDDFSTTANYTAQIRQVGKAIHFFRREFQRRSLSAASKRRHSRQVLIPSAGALSDLPI